MLVLESTVTICSVKKKKGSLCLGAVGQHRAERALLTVYTREGTIEAEHKEKRCRSCGTGYWHGYSTQVKYCHTQFKLFPEIN